MLKPRRFIVPHRNPSKTENFVFYAHELRRLPVREREVLRLRVGLVDGRTHTLKEIAAQLGIGPERARQIQTAALLACRRQREAADDGEPKGVRISARRLLLPRFSAERMATRNKSKSAAGSSNQEGRPLTRTLALDRGGQERLAATFDDFFLKVEEIEEEAAERMRGQWPPSKSVQVAIEAVAFAVPAPLTRAQGGT